MTETDRALKLLNTHNVTEVHTETNKTVPISVSLHLFSLLPTKSSFRISDIIKNTKYVLLWEMRVSRFKK